MKARHIYGIAELTAQDPSYDTVRKRALHAGEIVPKIREALRSRTALEWEERFGERVPCGVVRPIEDMFDHPQVLAEGLVATMRGSRYLGEGGQRTWTRLKGGPAADLPTVIQVPMENATTPTPGHWNINDI